MRVAVVGAQGQLGAAIVHEFAAAHQVLPLTHRDLDVTKDRDVAEAMTTLRPDVIINCTAFNDVDGAEVRPVEALNLNAFAVRALSRAAADLNGILIHFGTDFVFDGRASRPYTEEDRPNPRSAYAVSKLLGEWFAADAPKAYVLRVESLFGSVRGARPAKGSVAGILNTLRSGGTPQVFEDRTVSPTYINDAAAVTRRLVEKAAPFGLYHCVGSGHCTWLEFAQEMARQLGVEPRLVPIRMADVRLPAERPQYCALSNDKLRSIGIAIPSWKDALVRYLATLRNEVAHKIANG
ncbi:MAG: dTDP-4-dehydrorhamnose reductase [Acidobacteriota bacterium]